MKERFRALPKVQKVILLILAAATVIFTVLYAVNDFRVGLAYRDGFLTSSRDGETRSYTGRTDGAELTFTVRGDTVTSRWGGEVHTYTVKEDPTALVPEHTIGTMLGVEVWEGNELLFRGGWNPDQGLLVNDKGKGVDWGGAYVSGPRRSPRISTVLDLWHGPKLVHQLEGGFYFLGLFCAVLTAVSLLFADEFFYLHLLFRVKDPSQVEPSAWELFSRTLGGAMAAVMAVIFWMMGFP